MSASKTLYGLTVFPDGRVFLGDEEMHYSPMSGGRYWGVNHMNVTHYVHRLVAEAFIPNPEGKPDVAHSNGDGLDNRVENLRWATEAENMADKKRHGTNGRGSAHPSAKLTEQWVAMIREKRKDKVPVRDIAELFGVSKWTVYDACSPNRTWKSDA